MKDLGVSLNFSPPRIIIYRDTLAIAMVYCSDINKCRVIWGLAGAHLGVWPDVYNLLQSVAPLNVICDAVLEQPDCPPEVAAYIERINWENS